MEGKVSSDLKLPDSRFLPTLDNLRDAGNSFQQSFTLQWKDIVDRLESSNNAIEARDEELREKENSISVRIQRLEKQEVELDSVKVSLEARLREVAAKEEECEEVFAELRAVEECVDDRVRRTEAEKLSLEKRVREEEEKLEAKKKECDCILEELRLKERECEKKLEELERLKQIASKGSKAKEKELEKRHKEVELKEIQCKKKLEELERLKQSASEASKLKESEVEKRRKEVELKEMQCKKKLEELERMNQSASEASKLKEFELEKQRKEVESKEVQCKKRLEELIRLKQSVSEASKLKEFELEKQRKEVESKEVQCKKRLEELIRLKQSVSETSKLKEKELEKQQKGVELMEYKKKLEELERLKQIASEALKLKEKEVEKQRKDVELKEMQCKKKLEELERDKESVLKDLKIKQDHVEKQRKDLELKEKYLDEQFRALRSNEMEIKKYSEELNLREQKCESNSKENESEKKEILACREENLKFIERVRNEEEKIDQQLKEIELEKKQLLEKEEKIDQKSKGFEMEKGKFMERLKELELKEKQLEVRSRELEIKEKKTADIIYNPVKREPPDIDKAPDDASLCFNVKMDGKALQLFLNERGKDHESLRTEVTTALSLSPNPAKLVLDAIQGFFPPHLKKGEIEFKEDVVRRSCIILLEQLRKISPAIKPHVKKEATELAFDWKRKMRADTEHSMEVLGFLQLLAAYKLASEFDANDLLRYLEIVAHDSQAPELFRILGFAVHISSFIQTLVRKKKRIEAIGFVYAFDLVSEFPPVPLLKDFLKFSRTGARKITRKFKYFDAKIEALNQRIEDVKAALKCIQDHKIVSDISPKQLKLQINDLEKQIAEMKTKLPTPVCTALSNHLDVRTQSSPSVDAAVASGCKLISAPFTGTKVVSTAAVHPATNTLWHQQPGIKRPRSAIADDFDVPLAEILPQKLVGSSGNEVHRHTSAIKIEQPSGVSFELLPSEHGISDSLHNENSIDHQLELKPEKHALDAIKKFCSLDRKDDMSASLGISVERCISLLESLRNMSHLFDPRTKGEALKFTADWKARLMETRQCRSEIVLFVEFLAAYGLTSYFPANDLLSLLDSNSGHKTALDLCQTLGLADKIPDFIESLIQRNQRTEAAKYVHVLGINDKFPIIRLLSDHWDYSKKIGKRLCEKHNHSIISQIEAMIEEGDALTAIIKCFEAYNLQPQGQISPEILRERIVQLEKQKAEKVVELDKVKSSARSKSISFQQQKKSANCSSEATPNAGLCVPDICPNPTVVSAPITVASQSPDFPPTVVPKPVTIGSPFATSASIDKSAPARKVTLPLNIVPPVLVARSSAASTTTPTFKLPNGSSPLPTASAAAAKAVAPSSTSGPRSTTISKTQHQQQGSSPLPTAGAAVANAVLPSTSGLRSTIISKTQHQQQGSSPLPTAGAAATNAVLPSSTSGPPSTTISKTQHQQQGSSPLPTAAAKAVVPSSTIGPPSTTISKTQHQQQAQNKRRKVVSAGPLLKRKHTNSDVHPMQPARQQQQATPLMNRYALCSDRPARYYSLEDHRRTIFRRSSYYDNTSRRYY